MSAITFKQKGNFKKFNTYTERLKEIVKFGDLDKYAREGLNALRDATPVDTGLTRDSWYYQIHRTKDKITISFYNENIQNGVPIAIILQYGHATNTGGWYEGVDYINPSLKPIFEDIVNRAWKEATRL